MTRGNLLSLRAPFVPMKAPPFVIASDFLPRVIANAFKERSNLPPPEIASFVPLPRNDTVSNPLKTWGQIENLSP